ncbi:hypothetical protein LDVICp158 [lymphocystis disease virus-China]|uniref:Uncharacterized protein n=2 Tax=Lymphocystis disease virus 2 TaxID=159183 RepID=A0A6F8X2L7_9VIRU|nr:hypothetical protein LDVICp158 [lymphocystis disease virus-China]AAU11003.1 hypothetical protein [lymphocystis disease virus-China]BCB67506.1 hypothetical protein [Lymphocystis disease virus 2]
MNPPNYNESFADGTLNIKKSWFHIDIKLYIEDYRMTGRIFNFGKPFKKLETHVKLYKKGDYLLCNRFLITLKGSDINIAFLKHNSCLAYVIASKGRCYKNPQLIGFCNWERMYYKCKVVFI